jgi:hypothetical protein
MNTVTFAIVYVGGFLIWTILKLPLPTNEGLIILMLGTLVWAVFYIWLYICRRWPLAGWFLFGFIGGLLGRGGRRW